MYVRDACFIVLIGISHMHAGHFDRIHLNHPLSSHLCALRAVHLLPSFGETAFCSRQRLASDEAVGAVVSLALKRAAERSLKGSGTSREEGSELL